jgi:uncharacterized membrane protein
MGYGEQSQAGRAPNPPDADRLPARSAGHGADIRYPLFHYRQRRIRHGGLWDIAAGIIAGLVAAVFGFIDWLAIPAGTRAKRIGLLHGGGNVVVVVLFAISWLLRWGAPDGRPDLAAFIPALLGVCLGAVTGWLGGELVDRLGVGVSPGANLDAPSSLSAVPAVRAGEAPQQAHS